VTNPFEEFAAANGPSWSFPENIKCAITSLQNYVAYVSHEFEQTHEQCPPELKKHLDQISEVIADLKGWNIDGPPKDVAKLWPQWVSNRSRRDSEDSL
jgi:hypothetical protein